MTNIYQIGNEVTISVTFTDPNNSNQTIDPTTVTLRVKLPDASVNVYTGGQLTKNSTGNYSYDLSIAEEGDYWYRWEGIGAAVAADEDYFKVRKSQVLA